MAASCASTSRRARPCSIRSTACPTPHLRADMNLVAETEEMQRRVENGALEELSEAEARPLMERLAAVLRGHDHRYYVLDAPVITDPEYDRLLRALQAFEARFPSLAAPDSPTQRVGGAPLDAFSKVRHPEPLLSLGNAFDADELRAWYDRVQRGLAEQYGEVMPQLVVEPKIDGLALALTYEDGQLTLGATRGNGRVGEDVTAHTRTIRSIPLRIPPPTDVPAPPPTTLFDEPPKPEPTQAPARIEVRGEAYMAKSTFKR